jgi:hypothetical protein
MAQQVLTEPMAQPVPIAQLQDHLGLMEQLDPKATSEIPEQVER